MLVNYCSDTANAPGTGNFTLAGAPSGRQGFAAAFPNGGAVYYFASDGVLWEAGIGTLAIGPPAVMTRTTVLSNSAGTTNPMNFTGATVVYNGLPSQRALWADASNIFQVGSRRIGTLAPAVSVDDAPRLDQLGYERVSTATVVTSAPVTTVNFTLPTQYTRFRVEWGGTLTNGGPALYCRFSNDGGASYSAASGNYYVSMQISVNGTNSVAAGNATFLQLTRAGTGNMFGWAEFDPASGQCIWNGLTPTTSGISTVSGSGQVQLGSRLTNIQIGGVGAGVNQGSFRLLGGR